MTPHYALEVHGARLGYGGRDVISGIDVMARPGEVVAVTGPNGSGKSTLLRGLAGFQGMRYERFCIDGEPTPPSSMRHKQVTYAVMDDWMWLPELTVGDHFDVFAEPESIAAPEEALQAFGVLELGNRVAHTLSSGQQRRVALASILVRPWRVLFVDEPEQRLDAQFRPILGEVLQKSLGGRAAVIATHQPELLSGLISHTIQLGHDDQ